MKSDQKWIFRHRFYTETVFKKHSISDAKPNDSFAATAIAPPEIEPPHATKVRKAKSKPTKTPTSQPTDSPTLQPSATPTPQPTDTPTPKPTRVKREPTPIPTVASEPVDCAAKPDAPILVKPKAKTETAELRVRLVWSQIACVSEYRLVVRQDTRRGAKVYDITQTKTAFRATDLVRGHVYFWRVKACNEFGCSASAWRKLTILALEN